MIDKQQIDEKKHLTDQPIDFLIVRLDVCLGNFNKVLG